MCGPMQSKHDWMEDMLDIFCYVYGIKIIGLLWYFGLT